ncbi:MAG: hypothetical protein KAS86_00715, partial [Candidatus Omnitrophica bacterium]|nr:hypothetical protein [Candidatus Omnitrophota bacterium]
MIPSPEVREVPIKEYLGMIRKRVRLIIGLMLAIVVFFISYYFFFPKTYVAKTTILIKKAGLRLMDPKKDPMTSGKGDYQDQLRLLHSGFLVERIARKLDQPLLTPKKLLSMVSIDPVFRTSMVEISVKGRDPVQIAEIANAWAREFIYQDMERKMGIAEYGVSRLEDQISETLVELQKAEKELDVFVTKYGVLAEREQLVDRLKAQKIRLEQELVNLSVRYKEKHLRIVSLNGQLTKVTKQIREENQKLLMLKEKMAAYKVLVKRADAYRQIYSELIQRSKQLDTARGLVVSDIGIIDTARVPKVPLGLPGKMIFILLAGGLFSGILLCFVLEYFDSSLKAAEEVEFYAKIPFLGEIPLADEFAEEGIKDLSLIYHIKTYSQTGQAFKCLEESLLFSF